MTQSVRTRDQQEEQVESTKRPKVSRFMAFHKGVWRKHTLFIQDPLRSAAVPKPMHKLKRRRRHLSADFLVLSLTCCIGCDWGKPGSNYLRHQSLRWALVRGPCFSNRRPAFSPPVCQKASHGCQGVPQRGDFSQNSFAALFFLFGLGDLCSGGQPEEAWGWKSVFRVTGTDKRRRLILQGRTASWLHRVDACLDWLSVEGGSCLFRAGDEMCGFFMVLRGAQVWRTGLGVSGGGLGVMGGLRCLKASMGMGSRGF